MNKCFPKTVEEMRLLREAVQAGRILLTPEGERELRRKFGQYRAFYTQEPLEKLEESLWPLDTPFLSTEGHLDR